MQSKISFVAIAVVLSVVFHGGLIYFSGANATTTPPKAEPTAASLSTDRTNVQKAPTSRYSAMSIDELTEYISMTFLPQQDLNNQQRWKYLTNMISEKRFAVAGDDRVLRPIFENSSGEFLNALEALQKKLRGGDTPYLASKRYDQMDVKQLAIYINTNLLAAQPPSQVYEFSNHVYPDIIKGDYFYAQSLLDREHVFDGCTPEFQEALRALRAKMGR